MKTLYLISLVSFVFLSACSMVSTIPDRSTDESMLNFLPYLNQKVAGYIDAHSAKSLDMKVYRAIISEVCVPLPSCGKNAETMFNTYDIQVRTLDGIFSIMLCDKNGTVKKMEDFSCNEQRVEIPSFQIDPKALCAFEDNWKENIAPYCPGIK